MALEIEKREQDRRERGRNGSKGEVQVRSECERKLHPYSLAPLSCECENQSVREARETCVREIPTSVRIRVRRDE